MAKGLNDYLAQESVAPYISAVVATTNDQPDTRAVHMKGTSADVVLTVNDILVTFHLLKGHTYPISCTKANSTSVVMLY